MPISGLDFGIELPPLRTHAEVVRSITEFLRQAATPDLDVTASGVQMLIEIAAHQMLAVNPPAADHRRELWPAGDLTAPASFLDGGDVYAPYLPLEASPSVDVGEFTQRRFPLMRRSAEHPIISALIETKTGLRRAPQLEIRESAPVRKRSVWEWILVEDN